MDSSSSAAVEGSSAGNGSLRVFVDDDDEESYFDLNINTATSTDFCFTLALSPLRNDHPSLHDVFDDGLFVRQISVGKTSAPTLDAADPPTAHEAADRRPTDAHGPPPLRGRRGSVRGRSHRDHVPAARAPTMGRSPSRAAAAAATGALHYLVKLPSKKIRMAFLVLARSLSRSKSTGSPTPRQQRSGHRSPPSPDHPSKRDLLHRTLLARVHQLFSSAKEKGSRGSRDDGPRVVDVSSDNSGILRAVAEAVNHMTSTGGESGGVPHNWNRPISAPCSLRTSPRHSWGVYAGEERQLKKKKKEEEVEEGDGSVASAIAHCRGVYDDKS